MCERLSERNRIIEINETVGDKRNGSEIDRKCKTKIERLQAENNRNT